ncbi:MAG: porin family protein [Pseudomonadota bacterium]
MQSRILFFALGASLLIGQGAHAQGDSQDKFYADIGYSRLGPNLLEFSNDTDPEFGGISGHFGYRLSKHWSVEGEATVGVENDKRYFTESNEFFVQSVRTTADLNGLIGVYAKGDFPATKKLNIFGRLGAIYADSDSESQIMITDLETEETLNLKLDGTDVGFGAAIGIGLTYDLSDKLYLRSDITRIYVDDADMDSVSLGVGVRF